MIPKLYKCKIMIISMLSFRFWIFIFLIFFPFFFSPYRYSLDCVLSANFIHIHIFRPKQTKSSVGRTKEEWIQGYEWMVVAHVIHHECSSVGSHSPALLCAHNPHVFHEYGRYFGQWNLSRGDTSLPYWSIIFCSSTWNADVMTEDGAAILDQK